MDEPEPPTSQQPIPPGPPIQPIPPGPPVSPPQAQRLPFSQPAIWGFVISCVSLFVLGFIGALGAAIAARGYRAARLGQARGGGLAIAGMIVGAVGFVAYAVIFIRSHLG
ncbi:DUF4190 domain-containing protein [Leifsonia shinshuensis]|uniref:DUF4190 domain-containing protein n=1 Tax=Leifsonia shinshuensis TaxID=150026 RepID=UPI001F51337C|nr:DUF4190 domain-containing protein [Leifsonia shinshuensis]